MVTEVDHLVCKDTGHNNGDWQENNGTEQVMHNSTYVDDPTQSYDHRSDSVLSFCSGSDSPENTDSEPEKHKPLPSTDRTKPDSLANMKKITVTIDGLLNEIESIDKRGFGDSNITEVSVHSQPKKDRRKRKTKK
ncbi:hypothetical protein NADFUDRAFT_82457 [Nadsonia fulvescens var. elongata DSM 6958]|uniref:Uncharacterized protein n=1 Tax=Nadsonia fulvescens var. elongata DSM 6958 TaxID=857566 RepID=A0A1E3PPE3_9ASCO|nr:hypothetical protein NADFUDRAFT_82457 [Nadsonia fulvescens var. elongata DSM 6958]